MYLTSNRYLTSIDDVLHLSLKPFVYFSLTLLNDNTPSNSFSNFYPYFLYFVYCNYDLTKIDGTKVISSVVIGNNTILLFGSNRSENSLMNANLYNFSVECAGFMAVTGRCFLVKKGCRAQTGGNTSGTKYYSKSCN